MTVDLFTPENQTNDLRSDVLKKENRFMKNITKILLPKATTPIAVAISLIGLIILSVCAMRYISASYQATLKYQVDIVEQQQKAFVELAKRGGQ